MFERHQFWFLIFGGVPTTVMRRDPAGIIFYGYDFDEQGWVLDNFLIDYAHGPSRRNARRTTRDEALAFLAERFGYRHGIDDHVVARSEARHQYRVSHLARTLLDAADPTYARRDEAAQRADLLLRAFGFDGHPADDSVGRDGQSRSATSMIGSLVQAVREQSSPWAGYLEGSGMIVETYQAYAEEIGSGDPLRRREGMVGAMSDCLLAIEPELDRMFVPAEDLHRAVRDGGSVTATVDGRARCSYAEAPDVLVSLFAADPDLRASFARSFESMDRADDPRNPWRTEDTGDREWTLNRRFHELLDVSNADDTGSPLRILREAVERTAPAPT